MQISYLTGQYPRATDTFIQREIAYLRRLGFEIQTFSVRRPDPEQLVGPEQTDEYEKTSYLLPINPLSVLFIHLSLLLDGTAQYLKALKLAWTTCQPGLKGALYQLFYFAEAGILARQLQRQKIRHIHNHLADSSCTVAMLAAQLIGISFSFTIHGPAIFFEPQRWCLGHKIEQALFVNCISYFCRSQCMLFSTVDCWPKLRIVHCGVEVKQFQTVGHAGLGTRLLYVGRLAAAKGLPILLESLFALKARCPQIVLTIIGDGPDRAHLEARVITLGLSQQVRFVGYQSQSEVRRFFQETDIFVLPSFAEGVPVSLMEAMASELPVISTRIAGIGELVEDGKSGYLVMPGNVEQIAQKIRHLHDEPQVRQAFGQTGRRFVEQEFNLAREAGWMAEILKSSFEDLPLPIRPKQTEAFFT